MFSYLLTSGKGFRDVRCDGSVGAVRNSWICNTYHLPELFCGYGNDVWDFLMICFPTVFP